jgi:SAM-dependent methyltransferase
MLEMVDGGGRLKRPGPSSDGDRILIREDSEFVANCVTKFFDCLYVYGWFLNAEDSLSSVRLQGQGGIQQTSHVGFDYPGIGPSAGFQLQALLSEGFSWDLIVEFTTQSGHVAEATVRELSEDREARYPSRSKSQDFRALINATPNARVLDIGGRDRSKMDLSSQFSVKEYVVLDILPGSNVDIVADAHEMSRVLEPESFDYVISLSVFEHILMPWKVAIEINRVLKLGGLAWISTHQTIGMHDNPWDFWRFSDTSWDALFNKSTGFRIVDRVMDYEEFILPFVIRESKLDSEKTAGFELSAVIVEKIGTTALDWPVSLESVIQTWYPQNDS